MARSKVKGPRQMTSPAGKYGEADSPEIIAHGKGADSGKGSPKKIMKGGSTGNRGKK